MTAAPLALLIGAALVFSVGGYFMKLSEGLTVPGPSVGVFACFAAGAALQAVAMRGASMSTTYIVVLGLEAITAYVLGVAALGETTSWPKVLGAAVVLAGVLILRAADT